MNKIFRPTQQAAFLVAWWTNELPSFFFPNRHSRQHRDALRDFQFRRTITNGRSSLVIKWWWRGKVRTWCG